MFQTKYKVIAESVGIYNYKIQYRKWWQIQWREYDLYTTDEESARLICERLNKVINYVRS